MIYPGPKPNPTTGKYGEFIRHTDPIATSKELIGIGASESWHSTVTGCLVLFRIASW